jgi:hypothetical protein
LFVPQALIAEDRTDRPLCGYAQVCACSTRTYGDVARKRIKLMGNYVNGFHHAPRGEIFLRLRRH